MRTNKASQTAKIVSDWLHFQLHQPDSAHLASDQWREISSVFIRHGGFGGHTWDKIVKNSSTHTLYNRLIPEFYQSFARHLLFRKLWIEQKVKHFAKMHPCGQVITIGAGLDTLALRLAPKLENLSFIEIDHPASQQLKLKIIGQLPGRYTNNLSSIEWLAADLRETKISAVLTPNNTPRLFIMEGLLMYLNETVVANLFFDLAQCAQDAQALFTFLSPWHYPPVAQAISDFASFCLRLSGEPFQWLITPEQLSHRMKAWHWQIDQLSTTSEEALKHYQFPFHQKIAEQLCCAHFISNHSPS